MPTRVGNHKLLSFASDLDDKTVEQAIEAARLPFVHPHVALMPDAHYGRGSSVGTVLPTIDAVIPAAVGVDIGCGMIAVRTVLDAESIRGRDLASLRRSIESAIPLSPGNYNRGTDRFGFTEARVAALQARAERDHVDLAHSKKWREQLGSLGGGNHFVELCLDEADRVWMFLHSGSRGVGHRIASRYIALAQELCRRWHVRLPDRDLAYLPSGTDELDAYLRDLGWAQQFAAENRAEMMDRFRQALAHWSGVADPASLEVERINCHHNYTARETHGGREVWLTRD